MCSHAGSCMVKPALAMRSHAPNKAVPSIHIVCVIAVLRVHISGHLFFRPLRRTAARVGGAPLGRAHIVEGRAELPDPPKEVLRDRRHVVECTMLKFKMLIVSGCKFIRATPHRGRVPYRPSPAASFIRTLATPWCSPTFDALCARPCHLAQRSPRLDPSRASFVVADRSLSQFLLSSVGSGLSLTYREFRVCCAAYLGVHLPLLTSLHLRVAAQVVDVQYGHLLFAHSPSSTATTSVPPGATTSPPASPPIEAGVQVRTDVVGHFSPPAARAAGVGAARRGALQAFAPALS